MIGAPSSRRILKAAVCYNMFFFQKTMDIITIVCINIYIEVLNLVYQYLQDARTPKERIIQKSHRNPIYRKKKQVKC